MSKEIDFVYLHSPGRSSVVPGVLLRKGKRDLLAQKQAVVSIPPKGKKWELGGWILK